MHQEESKFCIKRKANSDKIFKNEKTNQSQLGYKVTDRDAEITKSNQVCIKNILLFDLFFLDKRHYIQ